MKNIYFVRDNNWQDLLRHLSADYNLIAPLDKMGAVEYHVITEENLEEIVYAEARITQPVKFFVYPPQQTVTEEIPPSEKKTVILGIKACDLRALSALDKIFLGGDIADPFYKTKRENTILISNDCAKPLEVCFCNLLGKTPFPKDGFDLNLSFVETGILVETGSEKGKNLFEKYDIPHKTAEEEQLSQRQKKREETAKRLEEINKEFSFSDDLPALLKNNYDSPIWKEFAEPCVGCGACTNICPACHCFLLSEENLEKIRTWDSCQYTGFTRVAGGANPRKKLAERFKNRFYCKFEYKPENFGLFGCTGCGRCIEACQGKIDMREALTRAGK